VSEPWTFGVEPLPQTIELAALLRRVSGLALSLEAAEPSVADLIAALRDAEGRMLDAAPADPSPRIGDDAIGSRRVYIDHARDVGSFNSAFPEYSISVEGPRAHGEVEFPLAFEGPPGLVHGGILATFFDCVVQHHNCDVGVAGKTTSMLIEYRRPTPLLKPLRFTIDREQTDGRINSRAELLSDDALLCSATVGAVAGNRAALPSVSPRRGSE
jgi:hypothetical protein